MRAASAALIIEFNSINLKITSEFNNLSDAPIPTSGIKVNRCSNQNGTKKYKNIGGLDYDS